MEWSINEAHTLYTVHMTLDSDITVKVGALGHCRLKAGNYVYIGSAKKNIKKRVQRHYQIEKKARWHLDYVRPFFSITKIETHEHSDGECSLAALYKQQGMAIIKNFGSSDCRCGGHFIRLAEKAETSE
ncbi:MAG: DUF123 domain-containing protein [Bacillus sp. (in: firmicutes)]